MMGSSSGIAWARKGVIIDPHQHLTLEQRPSGQNDPWSPSQRGGRLINLPDVSVQSRSSRFRTLPSMPRGIG